MKLAIDSNIFIAFLQDDASFFESAANILKKISNGTHSGVYSAIVYGEVMYGAPPNGSLDAVRLFFKKLRGAECIAADETICLLAAELRLKHTSLKLPDAIHLATALKSKSDIFITADKQLHTTASKEIKSELIRPGK